MSGTSIMIFDKENRQDEYYYIAQDFTGNYVIGYIWVDKPWYTSRGQWTYYIRVQKYGGGGICGAGIDLGFKDIIVQPDTIRPYTQIEEVKNNQRRGFDSSLCKEMNSKFEHEEIFRVNVKDKIPYKMWDN